MKKPKLKTKRLGDIEYTESSGNIFADLGLANPEEAHPSQSRENPQNHST